GLGEVAIPARLNFSEIPSLPNEARQKLERIRPATLGQASRIPGLTPSDIQILWVHAEKSRRTARA
ncbi:MAG: hypothetical protein AAB425_08865, partial [Bdellovibrionota bacterium]